MCGLCLLVISTKKYIIYCNHVLESYCIPHLTSLSLGGPCQMTDTAQGGAPTLPSPPPGLAARLGAAEGPGPALVAVLLVRAVDHVKKSNVLVIIQSKHVLHRPWCLLESFCAIEAGIPIIAIAVHGRGGWGV